MPAPIFALTSLSPDPAHRPTQAACIQSWIEAGLIPVAFNHPDEIRLLRKQYDVEFAEVRETTHAIFGRHYVPINTMLQTAQRADESAILINADICLRIAPREIDRIRNISDGGLCYFLRYNHDGNPERAKKEEGGIDAFMMHGRHASLFGKSYLSMGQPWWDYWMPHVFAAAGLPVWSVEFPVAFHRNHKQNWTTATWERCCAEFKRLSGRSSSKELQKFSLDIRHEFETIRTLILSNQAPLAYEIDRSCQIPAAKLREFYDRFFPGKKAGTYVEVGAYDGVKYGVTSALAALGWRGLCVEPSAASAERCRQNHAGRNVTVEECAVGAFDGTVDLYVASLLDGAFSSIKLTPASQFADGERILFGDRSISVPLLRLDAVLEKHRIPAGFDLLTVDVEEAELDVLAGFTIGKWNPQMVVIEAHEMGCDELRKEKAAPISTYFAAAGYSKVYADHINTIFVKDE